MNDDRGSWTVLFLLVGLGVIFAIGWVIINLPRLIGFLGSGL